MRPKASQFIPRRIRYPGGCRTEMFPFMSVGNLASGRAWRAAVDQTTVLWSKAFLGQSRSGVNSTADVLNHAPSNLLRGQDHVISFAFAQEEMFAEQQVGRRDHAEEVRFADVIDVNAAALDILSGLAF